MLVSGSRKGVETFNGFLAEEGLPPVTVEDYFDCTQQPDVARRVFNVGLPELDFPGAYVPPNTEWVGALLPHRTSIDRVAAIRASSSGPDTWSWSRREPSTTTTRESS